MMDFTNEIMNNFTLDENMKQKFSDLSSYSKNMLVHAGLTKEQQDYEKQVYHSQDTSNINTNK